MSALEDAWVEARVGDTGEVLTGRTPPSERPNCFGDTYPFITPGDMHQGKYARKTERSLSDEGAALLGRIRLPANSVCVSCIGWQMGEAIITDRESFTNQQINTIIPKEGYDPSYLYYSFRLRKQELLSLGSAAGARTPILNKSAFSNLRIRIPSLPTQLRIASILGAYDDLIEINRRRTTVLEEMARRLFEEWFVHFRFPGHEGHTMVETSNGRLPEGWSRGTLGDLITLSYGRALKADVRVAGSVPVIGSSGVVGWHNEALVKGPGIVVGRKGNVGSIIYSPNDFYPIDTVFFVETEESIFFILHQLRRLTFLNSDAAVPGLNRNAALKIPISIPPSELMERYQDKVVSMLGLVECLRQENSTLAASRDLLLPRLISGDLSVANAERELEAVA